MQYGLSYSTPPAAEPVTVTEARLWFRLDHAEHDPLIDRALKAARKAIEEETRRQLMPAELILSIDAFPIDGSPIWLPRAPARSITSIAYTDSAGDPQTLSSYVFDADREPARLSRAEGESWPATQAEGSSVAITFEAGYADADSVPESLQTAILMLALDLYEHPGSQSELRLQANEAIDRLIWAHKLHEDLNP